MVTGRIGYSSAMAGANHQAAIAHANRVIRAALISTVLIIFSRAFGNIIRKSETVMPGLVPGIHVLGRAVKDVDGRDKPGHDDVGELRTGRMPTGSNGVT
jgi:hypothetical protein